MPKKLNKDLEKSVIALYKRNYNFSAIGKELNLHRHTVKKILEQRGHLAINDDPDLVKLNDEVEKFRKISARKNAYMKQQSKLIQYKSSLMDIDEDDKKFKTMFIIPRNEDDFLFENKNKLLITLLREMERRVPRSFHNICVNNDFNYDEILEMMWGSGKMSGDTMMLLKRLKDINIERFDQFCMDLGLNKKDIKKYIDDMALKELLDGIIRKNE